MESDTTTPTVWPIWREDRGKYVLRWRDPATGRHVQQSTDTVDERKARKLAGAMEQAIFENGGRRPAGKSTPQRPSWDAFCARYRESCLNSGSKSNRYKFDGMATQVDEELASRGIRVPMLADLTTEVIEAVQQRMVTKGNAPGTIASGTATLMSALAWATKLKLMSPVDAPELRGRETTDSIEMRGRPLLDSEFQLMLDNIGRTKHTKKVANQADDWRHLLRGLWFSGLRISEAMMLHRSDRDKHRPLRLDEKARLVFVNSQKSRKTQIVAITPDFADLLRSTQPTEEGFYFNPAGTRGRYKLANSVGRVISDLGSDLGIETDDNQYATAHDLRRSFARRWSNIVMPPVLQHLMRHASIETTLKFYVGSDADNAARTIYEAWTTTSGTAVDLECDQACDQLLAA